MTETVKELIIAVVSFILGWIADRWLGHPSKH